MTTGFPSEHVWKLFGVRLCRSSLPSYWLLNCIMPSYDYGLFCDANHLFELDGICHFYSVAGGTPQEVHVFLARLFGLLVWLLACLLSSFSPISWPPPPPGSWDFCCGNATTTASIIIHIWTAEGRGKQECLILWTLFCSWKRSEDPNQWSQQLLVLNKAI